MEKGQAGRSGQPSGYRGLGHERTRLLRITRCLHDLPIEVKGVKAPPTRARAEALFTSPPPPTKDEIPFPTQEFFMRLIFDCDGVLIDNEIVAARLEAEAITASACR